MAMNETRLASLANRSADSYYYEQGWREFFEQFLLSVREGQATTLVHVDEYDRYKYEGDLYGLLNFKQVPVELHWPILRVNNMTSPSEFGVQTETLLYPSQEQVRGLMNLYRNKAKKIT